MAKLVLSVNGEHYAGWKSIRVRRSLEQLADTFSVSYIDSWGSDPYPIQEGDEVEVLIERASGALDKIITGYVDDADQSYDTKSHDLTVNGRSKTGDIIDCAATAKPEQIRGKTLLQIAATLCAPFGISVSAAVGELGDALRRYTVQPGATVEQALKPICKKLGLLMVTDPDGNLVLTRGSAATPISTALVHGRNIEKARYRGSWRSRFSEYAYRSQMAPDDDYNGTITSTASAVTDDAITRYRPMAVIAEHQSDRKDLLRRSTWERNARAGKGQRLSLTVPGWEHAEGLWQVNTLVPVQDPFLRIDDQMLLASVEFRRDPSSGGTTSALDLVGPGSFDILDAPPRLRRRKRRDDP